MTVRRDENGKFRAKSGLLSCPECGHRLATENGMTTHRARVHGKYTIRGKGTGLPKCPDCTKHFDTVDAMVEHLVTVHSVRARNGRGRG